MEAKNTAFDLQGWLNKTLDKLREALETQQVGRHSSGLLNSISGELHRRGGTLEEIIIKFQQYGRFVDMGVGRGFQRGTRKHLGDMFSKKRNEKGALHWVGRSPKPWFSKTKVREVARLRELLLAHHENLILNEIESRFKEENFAI
ncbi:MAG: hypothetical protein E6Q66_04615 [Pedobacter sp.]|nr:MAG: hypothetical protein E6Q66_04615 [Pedobacter sp.]